MKDPRPGDAVPTNRDGNQQINYFGERYGWVIALLIGVIALVAAIAVWVAVEGIARDVDNVRGLIENSADRASSSAEDAAVAADRADRAERRANIAEAQAKQVFVELNRLGYPVKTTIEDHSVAPVEAK